MQTHPTDRKATSVSGSLAVVKVLLIVVAALLFWRAAGMVRIAFRETGLVSAAQISNAVSRLFAPSEEGVLFGERLANFWAANHRVIAVSILFLCVSGLIVRLLILGRMPEFLFRESELRHGRNAFALLGHLVMLLLHAGAVCGLIVAAGYDRATCAPLAFMGLIAVNVIWLTAALLTSGPDGRVLRGVWYVVILDLAAGLVVFLVVWVREGLIPLAGASGGSELILITACGGLALCLAQAWLGARVHCKRGRIMPPDVTREGRAGIA